MTLVKLLIFGSTVGALLAITTFSVNLMTDRPAIGPCGMAPEFRPAFCRGGNLAGSNF